jgi:ubiquinone/menaquinone biosynthesis C-methylase UbiE
MWLSPTRPHPIPALTGTGIADIAGGPYPHVDGIFTLKRRPRAAGELDELMAAIAAGGRAGVIDWLARWGVEEESLDITRLTRVRSPQCTPAGRFVEDWIACCGGRNHYFVIRWACPSYLCALALLPRLVGGRLLDLACGVGHLAGLLAVHRPSTELYLADINLLHLLVAKAYFAPRASLACIDFDEPLPLPDAAFDTVVISDALHYCENQEALLGEAMRVLKSNGELFVIHLHDPRRLAGELAPGCPATRAQYLKWIRKAEPKARILGAAEDTLIRRIEDASAFDDGFVENARGEPAGPYVLRIIKKGDAGRGARRLRLTAARCRLNAIYRDDEAAYVDLDWPSEDFRLEFGHTPLPARIDRNMLASSRLRQRLIRTGVLVPDPVTEAQHP